MPWNPKKSLIGSLYRTYKSFMHWCLSYPADVSFNLALRSSKLRHGSHFEVVAAVTINVSHLYLANFLGCVVGKMSQTYVPAESRKKPVFRTYTVVLNHSCFPCRPVTLSFGHFINYFTFLFSFKYSKLLSQSASLWLQWTIVHVKFHLLRESHFCLI